MVGRFLHEFGAGLVLVALAWSPASAVTGREQEPVVLTGADLPALTGHAPQSLVGFRRDGSSWIQVPVQVDQRAVVDLYTVLNQPPGGIELLTYTDPGMFTGADPDPMFDEDDELVFLAGSSGDAAGSAGPPSGTVPGVRAEIRLQVPDTGESGWVYLFVSAGSLDPAAGEPDIGYSFELLSGDYRTTYNTGNGTNPENSAVTTPAYTVRFSDRWIRDGMQVHAGGADSTDILDRHRSQFTPTNCSRTEDTFSNGAGAFIVNRAGPIRALRGYMGANSGPTSYRIHQFYREREVVRTALRVHQIVGVMDFMDYAPSSSGMVYANSLNTAAVDVDGMPDTVATGQLEWELLTGAQGTVAQVHRFLLEQPGLEPGSYYSDEAEPAVAPCAGDGSEFGASGHRFDQTIRNTDPALEQQTGELYRFELIRTLAYGPPNQSNGFATDLAGELAAPLVVAVDSNASCPDGDVDGYAVCNGTCELPPAAECGDCDDGNGSIYPGAAEVCNGLDDDCDGSTDEEVTTTFYRDGDGDGYGDPGNPTEACSLPVGHAANPDDCNDGDGSVYPGAWEQCGNGTDDDCDGLVDAADPNCPTLADCPDGDGDLFAICDGVCGLPPGTQCGDCNDASAGVYPGAAEVCNGLDDDCDGSTDEDVTTTFYRDGDGDGYGDPGNPIQACGLPVGYAANPDDCDDGNGSVYPGAGEQCRNGIDDNCDGLVDDADDGCQAALDCPDVDGDRYAVCDAACIPAVGVQCGDCDDAETGVRPGGVELCNGLDDDCNEISDDPLCSSYDVNQDRRIDAGELVWLGRAFGLCSADPAVEWWWPVDYDGSGCIDGEDLAVLANLWGLVCSGDLLVCP